MGASEMVPGMVEPVIDPERHRVIDISYTVEPGENTGRPFAIRRNLLADNSYRYDVLETHSHVGTHVEGGRHFYGDPDDDPDIVTTTGKEDNRSILEYPLETFYGPGCLLSVTETEITADTLADAIGDVMADGDIVVARNDTGEAGGREDTYEEEQPAFTPEAAEWLADRGMKGLVLGEIGLGRDVEDGNLFHDVLMSEGAVFVEIVDNLHAIEEDRFTVMALPYKVETLGSSFCRAVVIEER